MGRNIVENTSRPNLMKWGANAAFKEMVHEENRRGIPKGTRLPFKYSEPRTPFEALRMLLQISQVEWCEILNVASKTVSHTERGNGCASIPLAKRMQEEARLRGVAVTLDELYQHVIPWGMTIRDGVLVKESAE